MASQRNPARAEYGRQGHRAGKLNQGGRANLVGPSSEVMWELRCEGQESAHKAKAVVINLRSN